jgi:hypothetical protein
LWFECGSWRLNVHACVRRSDGLLTGNDVVWRIALLELRDQVEK